MFKRLDNVGKGDNSQAEFQKTDICLTVNDTEPVIVL